MATIKIDRGFTQKIHAHELTHPSSMEPPPEKKPRGPKSGAPVKIILAVVGIVAVLAVIGLAVALSGGGDKKKKAPAQPVAAVPAAKPAEVAPPVAKTEEPGTAVDPDLEFYKKAVAEMDATATNRQAAFAALNKTVKRSIPLGSPQGLLCEYYENIPSKQIRALRDAAIFPLQPTRTVQVGAFNLSENIGDRYGVRVRGYLVPAATGKYRFSVCADDSVEFSLSEDESPEHLSKLVSYEGSLQPNKWTARKDQESPERELVAGKRYYLEALMKEDSGSDHLSVAWKGPVSKDYVIIDSAYLQPWTGAAAPAAAPANAAPKAAESRNLRAAREAAQAPARAAVEEQQRKNGVAYRYADAAEVLKRGKSAWRDPDSLVLIETAILRFDLLARMRSSVQAEIAKAPLRGVWTAFGGALDVTTADNDGLTVAPGRIVAWAKVPPEQMLKLINATLPKAIADPATKGSLFLAAAVYCKDVSGGLDLALKYRERALAQQAGLAALAERVLGGTPESFQAEARMKASRAELERLVTNAGTLAAKADKQQADLAAITGLVPGLLAEYWDNVQYSLKDAIAKGVLNRAPDSMQTLELFETPRNRAEKFIARVRGYITPTETDEYYFYIAADDQGEFWISSDDTPEKLALCVKTEAYTNYRVWDKDKRHSVPVRLVKGKNYFVEAYLREGEKNDHLSVAWSPVAKDDPQVVTSANLLYAATAGFTPKTQELRKQIVDELKSVTPYFDEVRKARAADQAFIDSDQPASGAAADDLQRQVGSAKDALRNAETRMKQIDALIAQLKATMRPDPAQK